MRSRLLGPRDTAAAWLLPGLFLLVALPVLVVLALTVPTGEPPDEPAHVLRADSVRHGSVAGYRRVPPGGGAPETMLRAEPSLFFTAFAFDVPLQVGDKHLTRARLEQLLALPWTGKRDPLVIPNTALYPPLLYIPAAAGLGFGKWAGLGPYQAILLARLCNALLFLGLALATLRLARQGRPVLFALLALPMTLSLAASVNHDGPIIAGAALAGALLGRGSRAAWWGGVALFGLVAMAKPYLLPLALLLPATLPGGLRRSFGTACAGLLVGTVPALAWGGAMAWLVATPFIRGEPQVAGPLFVGPPGTMFASTDAGEQLRVLLARPERLVVLPLESLSDGGLRLWREFIGVLGKLDLVLPDWVYDGWSWALPAAMLAGLFAARTGEAGGKVRQATAALLGGLGAVWCMYLVQYLTWTRVGDAFIEGVQGRYFLPLAVLVLPAVLPPLLSGRAGPRWLLTLPAVAMAALGLGLLPVVVLGTYYLR